MRGWRNSLKIRGTIRTDTRFYTHEGIINSRNTAVKQVVSSSLGKNLDVHVELT